MIPARITPSDSSALALPNTATAADAINVIVADLLALYFKTRNFHWHMLDEWTDQAEGRAWFLFETSRSA